MTEVMLCNILTAKFIASDDEVMDYYDFIPENVLDSISNIEAFELDLDAAFHNAKDILMAINSLDTCDEEFFEDKSSLYSELWDKVKPYLEKYVD